MVERDGIEATPARPDEKQCKMLFCNMKPEITVYAPEYGEEIEVCPLCLAEKMGEKEPPKRRKWLAEVAAESFKPQPWEIISDISAEDLGIPER